MEGVYGRRPSPLVFQCGLPARPVATSVISSSFIFTIAHLYNSDRQGLSESDLAQGPQSCRLLSHNVFQIQFVEISWLSRANFHTLEHLACDFLSSPPFFFLQHLFCMCSLWIPSSTQTSLDCSSVVLYLLKISISPFLMDQRATQ